MNFQIHKIRVNSITCISGLIFILFCSGLVAQTVAISGKITSNRFPMKQVQVTIIDNSDTSKTFTTQTDDLGNYQVKVSVTSLGNNTKGVTDFQLQQNYPNPFSESTSIRYRLKNPGDARVAIYDILGREIKRFALGWQASGTHNIVWDGRNQFGEKIAPGIYFYKLQTSAKSLVRKMVHKSGTDDFFISTAHFQARNDFEDDKHSVDLQLNDFTIKLQNTGETFPTIHEKEITNVLVKNDTTINFSVDFYVSARTDFAEQKQIIRGFGAANILLWRPDMTDSEIETAFGNGDGQLGFTILRLMVEKDSERWDKYIPTAKKAYDMGATIIASPWFAPNEMVETVNNIERVKYDMYDAYAAHLDSFATYMNNNGVPIYGVSIQNEPDITDNWTSWTSQEMFTFMRDHAHAITSTRVMAPESFQFRREMTDPILNDSLAAANTDIICGHIYGGGLASYPLAEEKGKEIWMTEYLINSDGNGVNMDTSWTAAMLTAQTISDCMDAGMNAYVWWYLVRYYGPICDGSYLIKGEVTKKGYVMSQFSKFIREGYHRVAVTQYPAAQGISLTAYRDSLSSNKIIVAINNNITSEEVALSFENTTIASFTPFITSLNKDVEQADDISVSDNRVILTLEPGSVTTFVAGQ